MQYIGKILYNKPLTLDKSIYELAILQSDAAKEAKGGRFLHIKCGNLTLRRPISVCDICGDIISVCYQIRGKGTEILSKMRENDDLDFLLCGNHFEYFPSFTALLIGGGIGIYPLLQIGKDYGKNAYAALGFRNEALVNKIEDFKKYGINTEIISDDGSTGKKGFVTELAENILKNNHIDVIYACGPYAMLKNTAKLAEKYDILCFVSMEERMACGVGACLGCVCKTKVSDENGNIVEKYKRVCKDGPVFNAREIVWQ